MNIVLGHGPYDSADQAITNRIQAKRIFLALPPGQPDYPWLQPHHTIHQKNTIQNYTEFLYILTEQLRTTWGPTQLILPRQTQPQLAPLKPIHLDHPARQNHLQKAGITLLRTPKNR